MERARWRGVRGRRRAAPVRSRAGGLVAAVVLVVVSFPVRSRAADAAGTLSTNEAFVTAAYSDFLGRSPTAQELTATITSSMASEAARARVVGRLATSPEWVRVTVDRLYTDTLGRPGDTAGTDYWVGVLTSGRMDVAAVAAWFYASPEYFAGFGRSDLRTWVEDLYTKILHRSTAGDESGVAYWVEQAGRHGRNWVALRFYQSDESCHTRVDRLYRTLLGRAPEQGGWDYWAGVIPAKGDLALAANLASSYEYYGRAADRYGTGLPVVPSTLTFTKAWSTNLGTGHMIVRSSPMAGKIDGGSPVVIVGDQGGHVEALRLDDGSVVWQVATPDNAAADSAASFAGSGTAMRINMGVGNSAASTVGGYLALAPDGTRRWFVRAKARPTGATTVGVMSGMAVGNFRGTGEVVSGSMAQMAYALDGQGRTLTGFPWFEADSNFATPAVADLDGDGSDEIIMGGDSTAGVAFGKKYTNGGHIRVLSGKGNAGGADPGSGLICHYDTTQVVQSSPAVGPFLSGGGTGIVAGTGTYWSGASDTNKIVAVDSKCKLRWKVDLHANTSASPALADVKGNGSLAVVAGTRSASDGGTVYALNGTNGAKLWSRALPGGVYGGIATADLRGSGTQDVVVATPKGVSVLNGATGAIIGQFAQGAGFQNTVLITRDPDGRAGITVAGYNGLREGIVAHYRVGGDPESFVGGVGGWPMFHHDTSLSGNALHAG